MAVDSLVGARPGPRWGHVLAFIGLTFGLTYLLNLVIFLRGGLQTPGLMVALQLQMLLPAASATVLGLFFFREHPLSAGRAAGRGVWFYYYFLLLTAVFVAGALVVLFSPSEGGMLTLAAAAAQLLAIFGLLLLIVLRLVRGGREAMARVWLRWGHWRYWLIFSVITVAYYGLQTALNAFFSLGEPANLAPFLLQSGLSAEVFLPVVALQTLLVGPFIGTVIAFGEEYGWRGYLQNELLKLGRVRGIVLLGIIWGLWHAPIILMGYNYPGQPVLGVLLMTLYTIGLAFWLGYAVLKSGSVILAAYLHALNNQAAAFFMGLMYMPNDMAFSFGIGIYGIVILALGVLIILRDPVWRGVGGTLPERGEDARLVGQA